MLDPWSMAQKSVKKRIALALGYRRMLNRASAIHWLNNDEQTLAEPLGLHAGPVVVPNGLSLSDLDRPSAFVTSGDGTVPTILFLGRLHMKKGLDILADAFAQLLRTNPAQLVVAGPDGGAEKSFRARIRELGLDVSVSIVGPLYGAEKWAAIDRAACFCLPSRQEGFSMAILEALGRGVPAVVSDACHFPEVQTARAGFVVPLVAEAVAEGLRNALADGARQRLGANGRALVAEKYLWDRIAARWIEIYGGLTGSRS
jgi:glycosyltransferase involved in cell wall biosynthesis